MVTYGHILSSFISTKLAIASGEADGLVVSLERPMAAGDYDEVQEQMVTYRVTQVTATMHVV